MIISFTILNSIFTYFSFILNRIKKENSFKFSPFLYLILNLFSFSVINFFLFDFNVNYSILHFIFISIYSLITIFFILLIYKYFKDIISNWKYFFRYLLFLLILLFFSIYLLFYHKLWYPYQNDFLEYDHIMLTFHHLKYFHSLH